MRTCSGSGRFRPIQFLLVLAHVGSGDPAWSCVLVCTCRNQTDRSSVCYNKADRSSESQQGGPFHSSTSQHSVANDMSISCWFQESFLLKKNFFLLCEEVQENSFGSFTRVVTKFCRLLEY